MLKIGKMSTRELADWFGISYGTFRNNKQEKLEELKLYAEFEEVYGGVNIISLVEGAPLDYTKASRKNYDLIKASFDEEWSPTGIDTCSNVAYKIYDKHKNELTIADNTAYNYVLKVRDELYGKPFVSLGSLGSCIYLWCRKEYDKDNDLVIYTELSDEEQEIKKKLMKKYFSTDVEKEIMVAEMVRMGEITKAEAYDALCEMKNLNNAGFIAFKKELEKEIGCEIVKATLLDKNSDKIEFEKIDSMSRKSIDFKQN